MLKRCVALALLALGPIALTAKDFTNSSKNWPQWRGPNRDNISPETGLLKQWPKDGPKVVWNARDVNGGKSVGTGYSSISVAGGRIFTMGDRGPDGFVFCLDQATGKEIWATKIYEEKRNGDGPRCTPTIDGAHIYCLSRHGHLTCLHAANGNIVWQKHLKNDLGGRMMSGWDYSESPLVDGDRVICTPGGDDGALAALNKSTGEVIWKAKVPQSGGAGYASIVISHGAGVKQYITLLGSGKGGGLVGVEASSGKLLWNYRRIANGTANIPTSLVKDDLVFCSTGYGTGAALLRIVKDQNGDVSVKEEYFLKGGTLQNHHGGMVLLGDHVYGGHGHNDGKPFCFNMKAGKFAWDPQESPGSGSAAVAYADGHLYFRWQNNTMGLVEATPEEFVLKSQFRLPKDMSSPGWQHPVILDGRMYLRGNNQLLCYDVKQK